MSWWSRFRRAAGRREGSEVEDVRERNILVISDIHLGEDVLEDSDVPSEYIVALNRELAQFVATYRDLRANGRLWHLVINGDMFDFVALNLRPEGDENTNPKRLNTPEHVVYKLERIFEIHKPLFKELARFVAAGHSLTVIEGNHDAETFFPEVRARFRNNLRGLAHKLAGTGEFDDSAFDGRVDFQTWFAADPGRFHIEHGHAYDEFCAFEYNLAPYDRPGSTELATPLVHTAIPHFAGAMEDFSTHGVDNMSTLDGLKMLFSMGPKMIWVLTKLYFLVLWEVLSKSGGKSQRARVDLADLHRKRLEELSKETPYGFQTLQRLDELRAVPAEYSVVKMVCVFHADRLFVGGLALGAVAIGTWLGGAWGWTVVAGGGLAAAILTHLANQKRSGAAWKKLEAAAAGIATVTGARYVVFGHSHRPALIDLHVGYGIGKFGERAYYLNSGSWVSREMLRGDESQGMTFVEITEEGAALMRWRGVGEEPDLMATTGKEGPLPSPQPLLLELSSSDSEPGAPVR